MVATRKKRRRQRAGTTAGQEILKALTEIRDALASGDLSKLTIRSVLISEPTQYGPKEIRALRESLDVSQAVFAHLVAVSPVLVAQWESGVREPAPLARRLLDQIKSNPGMFLSSLVRRRTVA